MNMGSKLLYESKGGKKTLMIIYLVLALLCFGVSVGSFSMVNAKNKSSKFTTGYYDQNGNFNRTSSGKLGGRDKFSQSGKWMLRTSGMIFAGLGVVLVVTYSSYRRCWLKIYEDHVEGLAFAFGPQKNEFYCKTSDIQGTILTNSEITLQLPSMKYTLVCDDLKHANDVLQMIIRNK